MSSGRLLPEQTDVSVYEVDGHVFLAEAFHSLRRHYYSCSSDGVDIWSMKAEPCNRPSNTNTLTLRD